MNHGKENKGQRETSSGLSATAAPICFLFFSPPLLFLPHFSVFLLCVSVTLC